MALNPIVTSLPEYVEQNKSGLIAESVLGSKSAGLLNLYSGIKGKTTLNLLNTDITLQDASDCGFNPDGDQTITQREITPAYIGVNMEYCDKNLLGTYAQHMVKIAAKQKTLPFEEEFIKDVLAKIDEKIEAMIWQGDSANGAEFDGLIKVLAGAPTATTDASAYEAIKNVYMAMPANVADKDDATIFVGYDTYRKFIQELVEANLYHFRPEEANGEYYLPATNVKVIAVNGLNGTKKVVGARKSNLYLGVDLMGDAETFDFWYSADNRTFRLVVEWLMGVQVAFPSEVVVGGVA